MSSTVTKSFLPDCKSSFYQKVAAFILITFSCVFFKLEILQKFSSHFIGGVYGDAGIYVWISKLFPLPVSNSFWFETNGFYPYSLSLAFSDNWIFPSSLIYALSRINFDFITSYNLVYIGSIIFAGFFTYLLLYSITGNFLTSCLAGITASNLAPFQHHLGHPQLQHYWILPLTLHLTLKWINSKNFKYTFTIGLSLSISFLCSVYLSIFAGYLFATILLVFLVLRPNYFKLQELLRSILALILGLIPIWIFINPYLHLKDAFGSRFYYEPWSFQATPSSYLSFGPFSWQYPTFSFSHSEAHLGIGATLLTLALSGFSMAVWSKAFGKARWVFILSIIGLFFVAAFPAAPYLLSTIFGWVSLLTLIYFAYRYRKITLGSKIKFFTNQEILFLLTSSSLIFLIASFGPINLPSIVSYNPFYIFYKVIPGLDAIRSVARFGLVTTYLSVIVAFFVLSLLHARKQISSLVVLSLSFFIIAENFTAKFPLEAPPKAVGAFSDISKNSNLGITLPYGGRLKEDGSIDSYFSFAKRNIFSVIWGYEHNPNLRFINGFSGVKTKIVSELPVAVFDFPSENSLRILSSFVGLDTIIILPEFFEDNNSRFQKIDDFLLELNKYKNFINQIRVHDDKSIYIEFISQIDLSAPATLLTDSKAASIKCKLKTQSTSNKQINICDPSLFNIVQIPRNSEAWYRCITSESNSYINIFAPRALKTIPANSIRISTSKLAPLGIILSECVSTSPN
jgi:hypothetical protein